MFHPMLVMIHHYAHHIVVLLEILYVDAPIQTTLLHVLQRYKLYIVRRNLCCNPRHSPWQYLLTIMFNNQYIYIILLLYLSTL